MNIPDQFDYHFSVNDRGPFQGPHDPSEEFFNDRSIEESVVREMIQNSLDAVRDGEPRVIVEFELRTLLTSNIPGIATLRNASGRAHEAFRTMQGNIVLENAVNSCSQTKVPVLRVGDYGTSGLKGSESEQDQSSALSTLTRGIGASAGNDGRGGSFGIGSAAGFVASTMRTVAYMTRAVDKPDELIYASKAIFASFRDDGNASRNPSGLYTNLNNTTDFQYPRVKETLGNFPLRSDLGTDIFVFDYSESTSDPQLNRIRDAVIKNFLVAIHRGSLLVRGITDTGSWELNTSNLLEHIKSSSTLTETVLPFYRALTGGLSVTATLKHIGEATLYMYFDDTMFKPLGAILMRRPLMSIRTYSPRVPVPYAAVFICENKIGNELLRGAEPPTHDDWSTEGPRSQKPAVTTIRDFIRNSLRDHLPHNSEPHLSIKGLASLLPAISTPDADSGTDSSSNRTSQSTTDQETAVQIGKPQAPALLTPSAIHPSPRSLFTPATNDPAAESNGRRSQHGGAGTSGSNSPDIDTNVSSESGGSIQLSDLEVFRTFTAQNSLFTEVILSSKSSISGSLTLEGLGARPSENFLLPITAATIAMSDGIDHPLEIDQFRILGLDLAAGVRTRLKVWFATNRPYRLGVRNA